MGKRVDIAALNSVVGTLYPPPFDEPCRTRERKRLGDAAGLTQYGVNRWLTSVRSPSTGGSRHSSLNKRGGRVAGGGAAACPRSAGACAAYMPGVAAAKPSARMSIRPPDAGRMRPPLRKSAPAFSTGYPSMPSQSRDVDLQRVRFRPPRHRTGLFTGENPTADLDCENNLDRRNASRTFRYPSLLAFRDDQREVVALLARAKLPHDIEHGLDHLARGERLMPKQRVAEASLAELLVARVKRLGDTVCIDREHITRKELALSGEAVPFREKTQHGRS